MAHASTAAATIVSEARDPRISRKYQVSRLVAHGGVGRVLEAHRRRDRRRVAIKVLHPELTSDDVCREQITIRNFDATSAFSISPDRLELTGNSSSSRKTRPMRGGSPRLRTSDLGTR